MTDTTSFLVVLAAAAAAPVAADIASRARAGLVVPVAVAEILLGALVGPDVLGLTERGEILDFLNQLGLGFLFFFAGYEIEFHRIAGAPLRLALLGWLLTLVLAYGFAVSLAAAGVVLSGLLVGSAMTTTALGTLVPVLRDAGQLQTRLGTFILGAGAVGEFGPVLIVTLLLGTSSDTVGEALLLTAFVLVAVVAAGLASGAVGSSLDVHRAAPGHQRPAPGAPHRAAVVRACGDRCRSRAGRDPRRVRRGPGRPADAEGPGGRAIRVQARRGRVRAADPRSSSSRAGRRWTSKRWWTPPERCSSCRCSWRSS
jgi:hypothetical protein